MTECAACTDDSTFDYSSMLGDGMNSVSLNDFLSSFVNTPPGIDSTDHLVTNFDFEVFGDQAVGRAHVRATHCIGDQCWLVEGTYPHHLQRTARLKGRAFCSENCIR
jgi:hypothetical protein